MGGSGAEVDAIAYFDGAVEPVNPGGTGGWGFVLRSRDGKLLREGHGVLKARPTMTNNFAEYVAAGMAVKTYQETGRSGPLLLRGDSKLVVEQMSGRWRVRSGCYVPVYERLQALLGRCPFEVRWEWVPRHKNAEADGLSKRGLIDVGVG
jgi:ribonuclease HI